MKYELTDRQRQALVLIHLIYLPMVANKTGRYPLHKILNNLPRNERSKVKEGIDALVEMNIFLIDKTDICLTNRGEAIFQALSQIAEFGETNGKEVKETLDKMPMFSDLLISINNEIRLSPFSDGNLSKIDSHQLANQSQSYTPKTIGYGMKLVYGVFLVIVVLGLMKVIFRY